MQNTQTHAAVRAVVVLAGSLDTKRAEYHFVRDRLTAAGVACRLVDTGILGVADDAADVHRSAVATAAGAEHAALSAAGDRSAGVSTMADGAAALLRGWFDRGEVSGLMVLGGSNAGFVMSRLALSCRSASPRCWSRPSWPATPGLTSARRT